MLTHKKISKKSKIDNMIAYKLFIVKGKIKKNF